MMDSCTAFSPRHAKVGKSVDINILYRCPMDTFFLMVRVAKRKEMKIENVGSFWRPISEVIKAQFVFVTRDLQVEWAVVDQGVVGQDLVFVHQA